MKNPKNPKTVKTLEKRTKLVYKEPKTIASKKVKSMSEAVGKTIKADLQGGRYDKATNTLSSSYKGLKGGKVMRPLREQENAMGESSPRRASMTPIKKAKKK